MMNSQSLIALVLINRPVSVVWKYWSEPGHIQQWNIPFDDWHCPAVENDFREGGRFRFRMESKAGEGFDHTGIYTRIALCEMISYTLDDGRSTVVEFQQIDENTIVRERFEPDSSVPVEMQKEFCQSVLNRFKNYVEQV